MAKEIKVPSVGESVSEVQIGEWLKSEGDTVEQDENLVTIESEKATVELPSPAAGRLTRILKKQGETVKVGAVIGEVDDSSGSDKSGAGDKKTASKQSDDDEAKPDRKAAAKSKEKDESDSKGDGEKRDSRQSKSEKETAKRVMPAAKRLLEEHGLKADDIEATGPGGRLLKEDVQRHIEGKQDSEKSDAEASDSAPRDERHEGEPGRETETVPMTPLRRTVARRLVEAQQSMAMLTTFNEIDMSAVMALRKESQEAFQKKHEVKLGFMSFFVKGVIDALKLIPQLNARIQDDKIVFHNYFDIGVAIGGGRGLVVPVLRNAERMSFAELEVAIADFGKRAQENKIKPEELQGGTFTISNGGVYGSLLSTPIVNPPQSGILGMHAIQERPVAIADQVVIRPMMYVALSYDHRIVDGREAVTFLKRVKEVIEKPARMLIEA